MTDRSFYISICIFLLTLAGVFLIGRRGEPVVVTNRIDHLPLILDRYRGTNDSFPETVYRALDADKHLYRHYRRENGDQIDLYIGYYGTKKGGRSDHNPYACLPGSGWAIVDDQGVRLKRNPKGDEAEINCILSKKGELYNVVFHWYQSEGGRILSSGVEQNVQRFLGRVLHNRSDGAYVQVSALTDDKGIEATKERVKSFASQVLLLLPEYWPEEK
jgi:EpsI family protein